jgi:D-glycero-beta-D-manno-heptose-7-phosphate kinase
VVDHLNSDDDIGTIVKLRITASSQQLLRLDFEQRPGLSSLARLAQEVEKIAASYDVVTFSDYGKGALADVGSLIGLCRAAGIRVFVDPKGDSYERYRGVTLITPNRGELRQVIGPWQDEDDLMRKAQSLRERLEIDTLLLTRSEEGISVFDAIGHMRFEATAHEVFDVTGAGDTVIGVMSGLMACGATAREAAPLANKAGGLVVGRFGTSTISQLELLED